MDGSLLPWGFGGNTSGVLGGHGSEEEGKLERLSDDDSDSDLELELERCGIPEGRQ